MTNHFPEAASDLLRRVGDRRFHTVLADPPWQFQNRTGKMAPEHKRLNRYATMTLDDILALPVASIDAYPSLSRWTKSGPGEVRASDYALMSRAMEGLLEMLAARQRARHLAQRDQLAAVHKMKVRMGHGNGCPKGAVRG